MIDAAIELPLAPFRLRAQLHLASRITALMGPSGSGKTSLLEALVGLRPKARGRVAFDGAVWLDSERHVRLPPEKRRVGYVPQDAGLFPHITARANVRFGARAENAAVETAIETLEIRALLDRYPGGLSGERSSASPWPERSPRAPASCFSTNPSLLWIRNYASGSFRIWYGYATSGRSLACT